MRVGGFHLTYCSNIHAGESWPDVRTALGGVLPQVRTELGVSGPLAIGLRLSAAAGEALAHPSALAEFQQFLVANQHYVFTINGFPYGAFHGQRVKEQVYQPDWRDPRRVAYSNQLASILAALLPEDVPTGSVSTVPGAFKAHLSGPADVEAVARRGAAFADFDNDGDWDMLVVNIDEAAVLVRNDTPPARWGRLELEGSGCNRDAIGARIVVTTGGLVQHERVRSGGSYLSDHDRRALFALPGSAPATAEIRWPCGAIQTVTLTPGRTLKVTEAGCRLGARKVTR